MLIGIVSDLHGNCAGLDAALQHMGAVDELWCAGDAVDQYRFSNAVVGRLRALGARCIRGNHEDELFGPHGERARAAAGIDPGLLAWAAARPHFIELVADGRRLLMFHSTPWSPYGEYLYPHSGALARLAELEADVAIYGHTHTQLVRRIGSTLVINPGSAGLAQDPGNGRRLSCAVLDTTTLAVRIENFELPAGA